MRDNADAREITDVLFTHTHMDHFNIGELYSRMDGFAHHITHPLNLYGNDIAISSCVNFLKTNNDQRFKFNRLVPFETVGINDFTVTPLLANHALWEFCYVYFIKQMAS